jgi:signal transduction histidine kinase
MMDPAVRGISKFPSRLANLSLERRFVGVIVGLLAITIAFSALLLWGQHRTAIHGADLAIRSQEQIVVATQLREALTEIERAAREGELPSAQISRFRELSPRALSGQPEEVSRSGHDSFAAYVEAIRRVSAGSSTLTPLADRYDMALDSINRLIEGNQQRTYALASKLREDQQRAIRAALAFLALFILVLAIAGSMLIGVISQPLLSLVRFLDAVDVEDDLPASIPRFNSDVPEVLHVARSFERLLGRLRGYRALNVGRLLIEKRRAEVIAASITDGVFLLRGEEILYANPVAERILGSKTHRGLNLAAREDLPGAVAVRTAITRTIPVEYTLEDGDRKTFYLIQTHPIDNNVIEQAEHSVGSPVDQVLDRFQADSIVVAQDVTLVRESEEAKRHFLGTLSHEVRTPVTSLTMATRLLKRNIDQIENSTQRALVKTCIDDVERLRGLVEDLVTVSRFETLTQRMDVRIVDLGKLIRHSIQAFQSEAKERGIELTCKVIGSTQPLHISIDATKVSWAVSNLMTNALRHTPQNGRIETELEATGDRVEFRVRDTGPGIDRKRQGRIFDKFNPHYDLRVARSGSAGMGLAIAREIVVAHGGKIWVASEPGQGALFAFTLPLKRSEGQTDLAGGPRSDGEEGIASGLRNQLESAKGEIRGTPASSG